MKLAVIIECCSLWRADMSFIRASCYFSLLHLLVWLDCFSSEEDPSTHAKTQLPLDKITALIFYIVPCSLWKISWEERWRITAIGQAAVSCIGPPTSHDPNFTNEISASSWFYYKEICYDARSHERKIHMAHFRKM